MIDVVLDLLPEVIPLWLEEVLELTLGIPALVIESDNSCKVNPINLRNLPISLYIDFTKKK